jgi:sigma-E factor negative regulatory protein RseB
VKAVISSRHGPAGRRAVTLVVVAGLLVLVLSAVEGERGAHDPEQRAWPGQAPSSARAAWSVPTPAAAARPAGLTGRAGLRLLAQAATAAQAISYHGVQVISWRIPAGSGSWLGAGTGSAMVDVWHTRGQPADAAFGLTPQLLSLLGAHYAVVYTGIGVAEGRRARIVEALRGDDGLAARFWLDCTTKLPLRRQLFGTGTQPVSEDDLTGLRLGLPASASRLANGQAQAATLRPWADRLGPAQIATLQASGWPVPGPRSAGLDLFEASQSTTAAGKVVDLSYSDGLSVVSLFLQRGQLPAALSGWRQVSLSGHRVYVRDLAEPDLTWSAGGYVFTVVADAPAPVVAAMVKALPHDTPAGFWGRMERGMKRLISWLDPLG